MGAQPEQIEQLYKQRFVAFRNGLLPLTGSLDAARDAVQEGFARALRDRGRPSRVRVAGRPLRRVPVFAGAAIALAAAAAVAAVVVATRGSGGPTHETAVHGRAGSACCAPAPGQTRLQAIQAYFRSHPQLARRLERRQQADARLASRSTPSSTGVRTLAAYTRVKHQANIARLPGSVAEVITSQELLRTGGQGPVTVQEPIVGDPSQGMPSIYLVGYPSKLCMIIALEGAGGTCYVALGRARGALSVDDSIVDGKRFLHGLVADDVTSVTVSLAATTNTPAATVHATIAGNVFVAPLPYGGGADVGTVTLTVTRGNGSAITVHDA